MSDYLFANGSVKSRETKILDCNKIIRLENVKKDEFMKVLYDSGFGTDQTNLESLINSEEVKTKNFLKDIAVDRDLIDIFFVAIDAKNIKMLYKYKIFGQGNFVFTSNGSYDEDELKTAILDNKDSQNKHLNFLVSSINNQLIEGITPRKLSMLIDQIIFDYVIKEASKKSRSLLCYLKNKIDFINFLTMIRIKRLNWDISELEEMLFLGGNADLNVFKDAFNLKFENMVNIFKTREDKEIYRIFIKLLDTYLKEFNVEKLELEINQNILNIMSKYKNDNFELGPIIYYYLEKQAEISNIRYVYTTDNVNISDLLTY